MSGDLPDIGPDGARWSPITSAQWYEARNATAALRDVLLALGLDQDFPFLRADLNAFGHGIVDLGRTTPNAAARIADLLALALELDNADTHRITHDTDQN